MTKKTKNILLAMVLIGAVVGGWAIWYVFFKPHRDVGAEKPAFTVTADAFQKEFESDGALAKYIDQAVMVEGTITEKGATYVTMGNLVCNYEPDAKASFDALQEGQASKVQGRVSTFNDLMGEIVIDKCVVK